MNQNNLYRTIIVDDHPLMRQGINQLLSTDDRFEIISEASNGTEAIALANQESPDLILLDLNMKGMSGLDVLRALRADDIDCTIVILTVSDDVQDIRTLLNAGADGYILKDSEPDEIINTIIAATQGELGYSEKVKSILDSSDLPIIFERLTTREFQVLQEVSRGLRNRSIAERLYISEATVKVHIKSLLKKLNVESRVAATILFLEHEKKSTL